MITQAYIDRLMSLSNLSNLTSMDIELLGIAVGLVKEYHDISTKLRSARAELDQARRSLYDEQLAVCRLKLLLREAIRNCVRLTPNVEKSVNAWKNAFGETIVRVYADGNMTVTEV